MITMIWSLFAFLVAITVLIAFHEFGHFWVARRFGVKVLRFSIGFGKPLWSFKDKKGTEYAIAAIPFGGYVKMLDENEGEVAPEELHLAFNRKPIWQRMLVVVAGPLFNIIFAIFAYWLMFVIGISSIAPILGQVAPGSIAAAAGLKKGDEIVSINDSKTPSWRAVNFVMISYLGEKGKINVSVKTPQGDQETHQLALSQWQLDPQKPNLLKSLGLTPYLPVMPAVVAKVVKDSPAAQAGIKVGDKIVNVAGKPIHSWQGLVKTVEPYGGKETSITVLRDNKEIQLAITPKLITTKTGKQIARLGIQSKPVELPPDLLRKTRYSMLSSVGHSLDKTWSITKLTFTLLYKMIRGQVSFRSISGPVGIAQGAGYSARLGISYYLDFIGLISISLGIINILPIPILDGGHFLYYLIELARGKPLSRQAQEAGMRVGLVILIALMLLAVFNDFSRIFT